MDQLIITTTSSPRATFLTTFRQQAWSLPDNTIYYITKNPSTSKCYQKMIQTCKHFFIKNPILIVPEFFLVNKSNRWTKTYLNGNFIDLSKVTSKIWVTHEINILNDARIEAYTLSSIIQKIYKSDIKQLHLYEQDICFDHLKFLASKCEKMECIFCIVMKENGSVVSLENIIEVLPKVKNFYYYFGYADDRCSKFITSKTVSELLKISHFSKLVRFALYGIPEAFDIETFYDYIKQNKNTSIELDFRKDLSDGYKIRLQEIVDEIIDDENREYNSPLIYFPGMTDSSRRKLMKLYYPS